jgi:hypothetical protein
MTAPDRNTPLRLADAITYAFPFGGMTVSGLRREAARGRLRIERIAGKDFTTLAAIEEMREMCRLPTERLGTEQSALDAEKLVQAWAHLPGHVTEGRSLAQAAFLRVIAQQRQG